MAGLGKRLEAWGDIHPVWFSCAIFGGCIVWGIILTTFIVLRRGVPPPVEVQERFPMTLMTTIGFFYTIGWNWQRIQRTKCREAERTQKA